MGQFRVEVTPKAEKDLEKHLSCCWITLAYYRQD